MAIVYQGFGGVNCPAPPCLFVKDHAVTRCKRLLLVAGLSNGLPYAASAPDRRRSPDP